MLFSVTAKSWTQILDLNPGPGPWKTLTQKKLDPEKPELRKTWHMKNGKQLDARKKKD